MKANHLTALGLVYVALLAQTGCRQPEAGAPEPKRPRLVFITTGSDSFWLDAAAGIEAAAKDFQAEFEITYASNLLNSSGADGIAFSPANGTVQLALSGRELCLLGVDPYKAGRKAGVLIKDAIPKGGKIIIVSGNYEAVAQRQGITDELFDPKFIVMESNAAESVARHLDVAGIVALSARDVSDCLKALCAYDKLGEVKLIGFGEDERTVEALAAGHLHGIITHQPYQYGYHAVRVLAGAARGNTSVLPKNGFLEIPFVVLSSETASHTAARRLH